MAARTEFTGTMTSPLLPILWVACAIVIVAAALRAGHDERARTVGRWGVGALFFGAGALVNAVFLLQGEDYSGFADGSALAFVRDTWASLVVPDHHAFIWTLVLFEATVGLMAVRGGRTTQSAYALAIAFHVGLLFFGWGFWLWAVPMIAAFVTLLRAERSGRHGTVSLRQHQLA